MHSPCIAHIILNGTVACFPALVLILIADPHPNSTSHHPARSAKALPARLASLIESAPHRTNWKNALRKLLLAFLFLWLAYRLAMGQLPWPTFLEVLAINLFASLLLN